MSNPALSRNPALNGKPVTAEELQRIYNQPSAVPYGSAATAGVAAAGGVAAAQHAGVPYQAEPIAPPAGAGAGEVMSYENTLRKTVLLFVIVLACAGLGWWAPILMYPGMIAGLVLGLVNAFKKEPSPALIIAYAACQGFFIGGISMVMEMLYPGIVMQAVLGTFSVFAVTLLLFRSGKVRTSPKLTKIFLVAVIGYALFSLVNLVLMLTGVTSGMFGVRSIEVFGIPLGVVIGVLAVLLAAYSLVMDFEFVKNGVENRVPAKWGWSAAFGIMVTLIWLYIEILRIIAILRGE